MPLRKGIAGLGAGAVALLLVASPVAAPPANASTTARLAAQLGSPKTPIQHLVVIFQENESFDHYFATYPNAANSAGEDPFTAAAGTPSVNGLSGTLLTANPNGANPIRLDPGPNASGVYNGTLNLGTGNSSNAGIDNILTCSQNHNYQPEQQAEDGGAMDKFPGSVGSTANPPEPGLAACNANLDLDYFDGNTVTAYWNYAQHFAMSDNSFGTTFGPSTPGAINVVSGDTGNVNMVNNGAVTANATTSPNTGLVADGQGGFSDINDSDPYYDSCSSTTSNFGMSNTSASGVTNPNVGDLLNQAGISWGWFEGGFTPTAAGSPPATSGPFNGYAGGPAANADSIVCGAAHNIGAALGGTGSTGAQPYGTKADYIQHHEPFQYYATTANPYHRAPTSLSAIGTDTQAFTGGSYGNGTPEFNTANHQYDMSYFTTLVTDIAQGTEPASLLPAVSYLKAPAYEDEHPANSDPVDGQRFVTTTINELEQTPDWANTAVIVNYDDSDGWYDHVYSGAATGSVQNPSSAGGSPTLGDAENPAVCGGTTITGTATGSVTITAGTNDTVTYTIGGGATQSLTLAAGSYTASTLATAISSKSGGVITAEANTAGDLVLTGNGLHALDVTGGDALATLGLTAGATSTPATPALTNTAGMPESGRCGFGPRLPFMVISPYAKANFVDHTLSDQASVVNFIEYNWGLPGIPGSADRLLTNATSTFDIANMFNFSQAPNPALYLDPTTFQSTATPTPVIPESKSPILFLVSGILLFGGAILVVGRRQLRHRPKNNKA